MPTNHEPLYALISLACASVGAFFDLKSRRIPNVLTATGFVLGLALHLFLGGYRQFGSALAAGLMCGAAFLVFYIAGGMGAGDVKLMAAVACILGMPAAGTLLVSTALAGGLLAAGLALLRGRIRQTLTNVRTLLSHHGAEGFRPHPELNLVNPATLRLPYALAIAAGSVTTGLMMIGQR